VILFLNIIKCEQNYEMRRNSIFVFVIWHIIKHETNRLGDVMVKVLASSAVDSGVKPKIMKLAFVASPLSTQY